MFDTALILLLEIILSDMFLFLFIFSLAVLCVTFIARIILKPNSSLKHAIVSSLAIMMFYIGCLCVYIFNPAGLSRYLAPLPFIYIVDNEITLVNLLTSTFPEICRNLVSMVLLAYLINQINSYTPPNLKMLGWFLYRVLCLFAAFFIHYLVYRVINKIDHSIIPELMRDYISIIIISILVFMFLLGFIKFLVGLVVSVQNPMFGGSYQFFFVNKVGKNLSRALGSTAILTAFVIVMHHLDYGTLPIDAESLDQYIPFGLCMLFLWVIVGFKM